MNKKILTPEIGNTELKHWAKTVHHVNTSIKNGYAFEGEFIKGEVELPEGSFILTWGQNGTRKQRSPVVELYKVTAQGLDRVFVQDSLDIHWAADVKDAIAAIVNQAPVTPPAAPKAQPFNALRAEINEHSREEVISIISDWIDTRVIAEMIVDQLEATGEIVTVEAAQDAWKGTLENLGSCTPIAAASGEAARL